MNMQNGLLQSFDLFKSVDVVLLASLITHLQPLHVDSGAIIYRRGDKSEDSMLMFFFVVEVFEVVLTKMDSILYC